MKIFIIIIIIIIIIINTCCFDEPHDAFEVHFSYIFRWKQNMFQMKHHPSSVV